MPGASTSADFFPIPIDAILSEGLGFDLYLVYEGSKVVLYRRSGASYNMGDCEELREKGITHFHIPKVQHQEFQRAVCAQACDVFEDRSLGREERVRVVRDSCGKVIEHFMATGSVDGIGDTLGVMAGKFGEWCSSDLAEFSYLLEMSERELVMPMHMVNVGVGCTLLAAELLGSGHEAVRTLSLGGLIHDVGKRGIADEVLRREGKLTDDEWALIRQHPEAGASILRAQEGMSPLVLDMMLNHHERLDGRGYPRGIGAEKISIPARICSIVDVYNALATPRAFRAPIPPRAVLEMMREEVGSAFDEKVFEAWERVVERMLVSDPERAPVEGERPEGALEALIPSPIAQSRPAPGYMRIVCADGSGIEAEIAQITLSEAVLRLDARLDVNEQVELHPDLGPVRHARYLSTRLGSKGETQLVFRLLSDRQIAA